MNRPSARIVRSLRLVRALLVVTALIVVVITGAAQERQLRLVSTAWSPFTNAAGQPRVALDLVEGAFARVGIKATTTFVEPAQYTTSLLSASFDGSGAAWRDAEREKALVYSQAYLENRLVLVGRKGTPVTATSFKALAGKRIAIVGGYSYGDTIEGAGPTFVRSRGEEDSLSLLLASSVDYMLMDQLVVDFILTNHPEQARARLEIGVTPLVTRTLHVAVRRSLPDAESIITRFNAQLRGMIVDGTYHRLLNVEWINADIDGDGRTELVPRSDKAGTAPPERAYLLLSATPGAPRQITGTQYYIGRTLYNNWTDVPNSYKVSDSQRKSPDQSTISAFTFTWK